MTNTPLQFGMYLFCKMEEGYQHLTSQHSPKKTYDPNAFPIPNNLRRSDGLRLPMPRSPMPKFPIPPSPMVDDPYYPPNSPYINSPYSSRTSVVSLDTSWRRRQRQAVKRGIVRKVQLTKGHFIAEYPVPTAVKNAIEPVYAANTTTEFS